MSKSQRDPKKNSSPIPDDFDSERYWFKEDFSLWMSALARRVALQKDLEINSDLHRLLQEESSEQRSALYQLSRIDCQNKVIALINAPIPVEEKNRDAMELGVACSKSNGDGGGEEQERWHLTVDGGLGDQYLSWHSQLENREGFLQKHEPVGGTLVLDGIWPPTGIRTPSFPGEVGIKVNLLYDDDVLRKSFAEWLKETRKKKNLPLAGNKIVNSHRLEEWHRMRILPYMDLWLYQQAFDVKFDKKDIIKCLFENDPDPNGRMDYEKRLKDTHDRAMDLIKQSVFFSLRYEESSNLSD